MSRDTDVGVLDAELLLKDKATAAPSLRPSDSFTREEAKAECGTAVRFKASYRGFREGAAGHVVDYHENAQGDFEVVILLDSPGGDGQVHERFDKTEYDRFFRPLPRT